MTATPATAKKPWSEADLESLPEDGFIHEVVDGELIKSPKNNFEHETICGRLYFAIESFNRQHRLGAVMGSSAGFWMENQNCRAPDISFIPKERLQRLGFTPNTRRFFPGAPDLAIEVLSPSSVRAEIDSRLRDFFSSGTQIAWIISPENQSVEICHSMIKRKLAGPGADLDGKHLLPGFRYPIADLFRAWEWR